MANLNRPPVKSPPCKFIDNCSAMYDIYGNCQTAYKIRCRQIRDFSVYCSTNECIVEVKKVTKPNQETTAILNSLNPNLDG